MRKYITKSELVKIWSKSLVRNFFPEPSFKKKNPHGGEDICLYEIDEIKRIEQLPEFIEELKRINEQREKQKSRPVESYVLF